MSSDAKIEANRRNAQKSTGPRTPAGKSKAALNAVVHGLYAAHVVSVEENSDAFEAVRRQLFEEWRPASVLEAAMIDQITELLWRRRRVAAIESSVLEAKRTRNHLGLITTVGNNLMEMLCREMKSSSSPLLRTQLYQARLDRAMHRALAELRQLQRDRRARDEEPSDADTLCETDCYEIKVKNDGTNPPIDASANPAKT